MHPQNKENKKEEQNKEIDDGVAQALEHFGMTPSAVTSLMQCYPAAYITEKLAMTHGLLASGSALVAKNPAGWLRRAIEESYQPPRKPERQTHPSATPKQENKETYEEPKREQNIITPPVVLPQPDSKTTLIWQQTMEQLHAGGASEETQTKLTDTQLLAVTDTNDMIRVPDQTALLWLERRCYRQIATALKTVIGRDIDLQFVLVS